MKFHIGDRVMAIRDKGVLGKTGVVVAVDNGFTSVPYLVDFEDFHEGHDGSSWYNEPWFPKSAKKPGIHSYRWTFESELNLISRAEDGNGEKTTEEKTVIASPNNRQCAEDTAPPPSPTHDPMIHDALTQLCAEQEGVTDILAFQRAGCHKARELYKSIGGLLLELDGYG